MPKEKKERIADKISARPFFLLKRLVEYEITGSLAVIPDREEVYKFFKNHPGIPEHERNTVANFVRRFLWKPDVSKITEKNLDWVVKTITKIQSHKNWKSFYRTNSFLGKKVPKLSEYRDEERERKILEGVLLYMESVAIQQGNIFGIKMAIPDFTIEFWDYNYDLKFSLSRERHINKIFEKYKSLSIAPYPGKATMRQWLKKNDSIFYHYGSPGVSGVVCILPLYASAILELKSGKKSLAEISSEDIFPLQEKQDVKNILIQSLVTEKLTMLVFLLHNFKTILYSLADEKRKDLKIGAFACDWIAWNLLKRYGFKLVSHEKGVNTIESDVFTRLLYCETSWINLKKIIEYEIGMVN